MSADDLLSEAQIIELGSILVGVNKALELVERINERAHATGLDLRQIANYPLYLMSNDISRLLTTHHNTEQGLRDAAMKRLTPCPPGYHFS
jgi:hypothetical protein